MRRHIAIAAGILLATAAQATDNSVGSDPVPPVCAAMPDRQGAYWDEKDWCQWLRDFENNRERRDREKSNSDR